MAEYVYTQNDNELILEFQEDGAAKDLSAATKVEIQLFSLKSDPANKTAAVASWDSVADAALFDLSGIATGKLIFKPDATALASLTALTYFGRLVVYSTDYPAGIVWTKSLGDLFAVIIGA